MRKFSLAYRLEKSWYWGIISAVLGVLSLAFGIYTTFDQNIVEIKYRVLSFSNVFSVHRPLPELKITFHEKDIQKNNLNLQIVRLQVINTGTVNIKENDYSNKVKWGVVIRNGEILDEVRVIESASTPIAKYIAPTMVSQDTISFQKFIFNAGEYFTIEMLILHDKDRLPQIVPIGYVAGIGELNKVEYSNSEKDNSQKRLAYLSYLFYTISFGFFSLLAGLFIAYRYRTHKIQEIVKKFPDHSFNEAIIDLYGVEGLKDLKKLKHILTNRKDGLISAISRYESILKSFNPNNNVPSKSDNDWRKDSFLEMSIERLLTLETQGEVSASSRINSILKNLVHQKLLAVISGELKIDSEFSELLSRAIVELETKSRMGIST